jgi:hypothetical protein
MFRFTIRDVLWLTVVVAVALAIYFVRPRQTRWEYRLEYNVGSGNEFNSYGGEGWELVDVESHGGNSVFYFKRPK